jgi:catalase
MAEPSLYEQLVDAMAALGGGYEGHRTVHAKGTWCEGTFTASPEAAGLSSAAHFQGEPVTAVVRFSNASGKPDSHDANQDSRGMAVKLRHPSGAEMDILGTIVPTFVSRTPEDFLELLHARRPDPETGQPDMEKLGAYLGAHPEAQTAIQTVLTAQPPASFAQLTYFSPHTYGLVDGGGETTWVRYRWLSEAGEAHISEEEARDRGRDYLREELAQRLDAGSAVFELVLQLAAEDDPLEDPTVLWPDERDQVVAGRLEIERLIDDPEVDGRIDVFDPIRIVDGIELSDDPVLHARPRAYSVSAYRRIGQGDRPDVDVPPTAR